jgi:hypothetical protein
MFRTTIIAIAATAAIGAAALTPTAASAGWHGHHGHRWHGGYRVGIYVPTSYLATPECYVVKKVVMTYNGPRVRRFTVCD